ncbi:MAG: DUF3597 domain-containing protein [Erythrobacter sp.]|jgi:hypothetical protein
MSIFGKIKDAIFGRKAEAKPAPATAAAAPAAKSTIAVAEPEAIDVVDVEANLAAMEGADKLNWRTSIVDLMKLIGLDSGFADRRALAEELGRAEYAGTAGDNIWLHKRVMAELAAHGGKVPAEFLD